MSCGSGWGAERSHHGLRPRKHIRRAFSTRVRALRASGPFEAARARWATSCTPFPLHSGTKSAVVPPSREVSRERSVPPTRVANSRTGKLAQGEGAKPRDPPGRPGYRKEREFSMQRKTKKIVLALVVIGVVAAGGAAFTAANTVPTHAVGYGQTVVTGASRHRASTTRSRLMACTSTSTTMTLDRQPGRRARRDRRIRCRRRGSPELHRHRRHRHLRRRRPHHGRHVHLQARRTSRRPHSGSTCRSPGSPP